MLAQQAQATGLSLVEVEILFGCPNDIYEQRMRQALAESHLREAHVIAFGDLFLADIREYREEQLRVNDKQALFPLWGRDTGALAEEFIAGGFEAFIVCVDPTKLHPSFAGVASIASCWRSYRAMSIPVARTASSTPLFTLARSSASASRAGLERSSPGMASSSAMYCREPGSDPNRPRPRENAPDTREATTVRKRRSSRWARKSLADRLSTRLPS
jgi:hypothetical protein